MICQPYLVIARTIWYHTIPKSLVRVLPLPSLHYPFTSFPLHSLSESLFGQYLCSLYFASVCWTVLFWNRKLVMATVLKSVVKFTWKSSGCQPSASLWRVTVAHWVGFRGNSLNISDFAFYASLQIYIRKSMWINATRNESLNIFKAFPTMPSDNGNNLNWYTRSLISINSSQIPVILTLWSCATLAELS